MRSLFLLQGFLDEVDGMAEDGDLKKVLEMSRNDPESAATDHGKSINLIIK